MLPTFLVGSELQEGQLQRVLPDYAMTPLDIYLLYPRHRHLSNKIRLFVEFVRKHFAGRPLWSLVD